MKSKMLILHKLWRKAPEESFTIASAVLISMLVTIAIPVEFPALAADPPTTLKAGEAYQGWVEMRTDSDAGGPTFETWNTQTAATVNRSGERDQIYISYQNPNTGEFVDYQSPAKLERIGTLAPAQERNLRSRIKATPLTYAEWRDEVAPLIQQNVATITQRVDREMDRFDVVIKPEMNDLAINGGRILWDAGNMDQPITIWVDPKTKMIREAFDIHMNKLTLTYGVPAIASIYDAGALRDAKIYDYRPTKETEAVLERMRLEVDKALPDGMAIFLTEPEHYASELEVHVQLGEKWQSRQYSFGSGDRTVASKIPSDWRERGQEKFFRLLDTTMPRGEAWGQPGITTFHDYDMIEPDRKFAGALAEGMRRAHEPALRLFAANAAHRGYEVGDHVDITTSPDRPGQIAVRVVTTRNTPDEVEGISLFWIDPAHNDRPVKYIETGYQDSKGALTKEPHNETVTEFSDYATLPAPDGRSYPTVWTQTSYEMGKDGKRAANYSVKTTFAFFPGRAMPKIPAPLEGGGTTKP